MLHPILDALEIPHLALSGRNFRYRLGEKTRTAYLVRDGKGGQFVLHVPRGGPNSLVWALPDLYYWRVMGQRRHLRGGAALTWFLFLMWDSGLIPAPSKGFPVPVDPDSQYRTQCLQTIARLWGLLWYLRNLAYPGQPVMFSDRFVSSLCRGELWNTRQALHALRAWGLLRCVFHVQASGDPRRIWGIRKANRYVQGEIGVPDPLTIPKPRVARTLEERESARKRIALLGRAASKYWELPARIRNHITDMEERLEYARLRPYNVTDEDVRRIVGEVEAARNRWRSNQLAYAESDAMKATFAKYSRGGVVHVSPFSGPRAATGTEPRPTDTALVSDAR